MIKNFSALADPTRRAILERLGSGTATITQLAEPFNISLTGIKKHVRLLEQAQLLTTEKIGRSRHCRLGPRRLEGATQWLEHHRRQVEARLDRLEEFLEQQKGETL